MAARAIRTSSNAYSVRSWPSSSFHKRRSCFFISIFPVWPPKRSRGGAAEGRGALAEYGVDRHTQVAHHRDGREGDQNQQQGILCQVLSFLFLPQTNEEVLH